MEAFQISIAFTAGALAVLSPCAIPLLPTYLAIRLGNSERSLIRDVFFGFLMVFGFMIVYVFIGIIPSLLINNLAYNISYITPIIGGSLIILGLLSWFTRLFDKLPRFILQMPGGLGVWGTFLFGIAYGSASLGCSLPVFLIIVLGSATSGGVSDILILYASYGAGVASLILTLTLMVSFARELLDDWLSLIMPHLMIISSSLMILAGLYMILING